VPLIRNNRRVLGVLDIDSPSLDRFAEADRVGCEAVAALYLRSLDA
jgi:L-methionine (R)-S-oxide reductase